MRQFRDVEQIGEKLAHHFAGVVFVIIGKGKPLQVVEKILPHVAFHSGAHDVAPSGDEILAAEPDQIKHKHSAADPENGPENLFPGAGEKPFGQIIQNLRERKVNRRKHQRADHIKPEQKPVWPIITNKSFQWPHFDLLQKLCFCMGQKIRLIVPL